MGLQRELRNAIVAADNLDVDISPQEILFTSRCQP